MKFTPTISTKEMREKKDNPNFNYVLMCNKICGSAHYKMKMIVVVDTPEQYAAWKKSKTTFKDDYLKPAAVASDSTAVVAPVGDSTKMAMK